MLKLLEGSLLFKWITALAAFIDAQWEKSFVGKYFSEAREPDGGVFFTLVDSIQRLLCKGVEKLRLKDVIAGSVFAKPFFWSALAVLLAPVAPTMIVLIAVLAGFGSLFLRMITDASLRLDRGRISRWMLIYALVYAVSAVFSVTHADKMSYALTLVFTLFTIVLATSAQRRTDAHTLIYLMVISGFLVAAYGFFLTFTGAENLGNWVDKTSFGGLQRMYSTLDNPNMLAHYLLLTIPLGVAVIINAKNANARIAGIIATLAMLAAMLMTYSRGGWLGLALSAFVFLVLLDRRVVSLGIAGVFGLLAVMPRTVISRLLSIGNISDSSTTYRIYIWKGSARMLTDHWLFGIGPGVEAFRAVYPYYALDAIVAPHAHSLYLMTLCETGVIGFAALMGVILSVFRTAGTAIRSEKDSADRVYLIAAISGLTGYLFQGATDWSFYNYRVMLMFWIVAALCAILSRKEKSL